MCATRRGPSVVCGITRFGPWPIATCAASAPSPRSRGGSSRPGTARTPRRPTTAADATPSQCRSRARARSTAAVGGGWPERRRAGRARRASSRRAGASAPSAESQSERDPRTSTMRGQAISVEPIDAEERPVRARRRLVVRRRDEALGRVGQERHLRHRHGALFPADRRIPARQGNGAAALLADRRVAHERPADAARLVGVDVAERRAGIRVVQAAQVGQALHRVNAVLRLEPARRHPRGAERHGAELVAQAPGRRWGRAA